MSQIAWPRTAHDLFKLSAATLIMGLVMNAETLLRSPGLLRLLVIAPLALAALIHPACADAGETFHAGIDAKNNAAANWIEICRQSGGGSCEEARIQFAAPARVKRVTTMPSQARIIRSVPSPNVETSDQSFQHRLMLPDYLYRRK